MNGSNILFLYMKIMEEVPAPPTHSFDDWRSNRPKMCCRSLSRPDLCKWCFGCAHRRIKQNCPLCSNCGHNKVKSNCKICYGCEHHILGQNCNKCRKRSLETPAPYCTHIGSKDRVGCEKCQKGLQFG